MAMVLYTKCIFEPRDAADGRRISVMSRHTLKGGLTIDNRIKEGESYDEWRKILAPPDELVWAHYHQLPWEEFTEQYTRHLRTASVSDAVSRLAEEAATNDITILCVEPKGENCHRLILAAECRRYVQDLAVLHR